MSVQRQEQPVREVSIEAMRDARLVTRQDLVVVEEPLEIRVAESGDTGPGTSMSITMRTPGQDIELAVGFLHGEGIVRAREDIADSRICGPVGNVVRIQLSEGAAFDAGRLQRNFYTTSSCGVCGNASLAAVERMMRSPNVDGIAHRVGRADRVAVGPRARGPGSIPRDGRPACVLPVRRERQAARHPRGRRPAQRARQAGRRAAARGRTAAVAARVLFLSGRASFELLQKAAAAGIPVVAAVGAPSSLAIDLAQRTGILLVGFLRGHSFNVYAHRERLQ